MDNEMDVEGFYQHYNDLLDDTFAKVLGLEAPERHELLSAAGWEVDDCAVDRRPFIDVPSAARGMAKAIKTLKEANTQ